MHSKGAHARANPRSSKTDWGSVSPHYTLPPPSVFDLLATMAGLYGGEVRQGGVRQASFHEPPLGGFAHFHQPAPWPSMVPGP